VRTSDLSKAVSGLSYRPTVANKAYTDCFTCLASQQVNQKFKICFLARFVVGSLPAKLCIKGYLRG